MLGTQDYFSTDALERIHFLYVQICIKLVYSEKFSFIYNKSRLETTML